MDYVKHIAAHNVFTAHHWLLKTQKIICMLDSVTQADHTVAASVFVAVWPQ